MKLNYKRTLLVGFAFFAICAFWQAYDAIVPLMLTNKFGLDQGLSGVIMSLDNVLALFMLPLFGALSDKTNTRFGKRTPFVVIGTILAIVCFVCLTFADNAQLAKVTVERDVLWESAHVKEIENKEYDSINNPDAPKTVSLENYAANMFFNKSYADLSDQEKQDLKAWFGDNNKLNYDTVYSCRDGKYVIYYSTEVKDDDGKIVKQLVDADGNILKDGNLLAAHDNEIVLQKGIRTKNAYVSLVSGAQSVYANQITKENAGALVAFVLLLLLVLISMATFRSPAVALMPDVTPKPLRSKANAIINLMGTAGGILVLVLGMIFKTGSVKNQMMSYTWYVVAVCSIMLVALVVFLRTVKEKRWNEEMLAAQELLDAELPQEEAPEQATQPDVNEKLPKDKLRSLIFILASVALWFIGYNAITSKYSVYAVNVLDKDHNSTLLIAQIAAVIAYIPVGILASKFGRKRTIMMGIILLTAAFTGAIFVTSASPIWLLYILFALAGIAWATINVNSFPMVVELSKGGNIGKYTGYYYTASMAAQIVTPILSGYLMTWMHSMSILFPYGAIFVGLSFVTMCFVKHGDSRPEAPKDKMEMLAGADD